MIVRFGCSINSSGKKGVGITLTMMDGRIKIQNPGYEYPVLTGKVLRAETNRGKNKNDGQPELLPSFHSFPSVQACSRRQRCNLYISTSTENRNRFQWFQTSIHYSVYIQRDH